MKRAVVLATVVVAACANPPERAEKSAGQFREIAAAARRWCWDTLEVRALACADSTAHRSGDTLTVRLADGRDLPFVDDPRGEAPGGYHYVGRIPQPPVHVVQQYGHETWPRWIFVSERTGSTAVANDEPLLSPDSSRFVTASQPDWNNCSERDHPSLDVWRFADPLPVLEWRLDPFDCRRRQGWGPTNPRWRGTDTLEFVHNEEIVRATATSTTPVVERRQSPGLAVRDRTGWRVGGR